MGSPLATSGDTSTLTEWAQLRPLLMDLAKCWNEGLLTHLVSREQGIGCSIPRETAQRIRKKGCLAQSQHAAIPVMIMWIRWELST